MCVAELFEALMWRGCALFRAGSHEAAAGADARLDTAEAAFAEGMARIGGRGYRRAIAVFEKVLALEPGNQTAREQPATGEDAGIGVDEVVFDDEAVLGAETVIAAESTMTIETADQWMRSLDRRRAGLLRFRFALEAARCEP